MSCFKKFLRKSKGGFDLPAVDTNSVNGINFAPYRDDRTRYESFGGQGRSISTTTNGLVAKSSFESGVGSMNGSTDMSMHQRRVSPGPPPQRDPPPVPVPVTETASRPIGRDQGTNKNHLDDNSIVNSLPSEQQASPVSTDEVANKKSVSKINEMSQIENNDVGYTKSKSTEVDDKQDKSASVEKVSKISDKTRDINNLKTFELDDDHPTDSNKNFTHNELDINSSGKIENEAIVKEKNLRNLKQNELIDKTQSIPQTNGQTRKYESSSSEIIPTAAKETPVKSESSSISSLSSASDNFVEKDSSILQQNRSLETPSQPPVENSKSSKIESNSVLTSKDDIREISASATSVQTSEENFSRDAPEEDPKIIKTSTTPCTSEKVEAKPDVKTAIQKKRITPTVVIDTSELVNASFSNDVQNEEQSVRISKNRTESLKKPENLDLNGIYAVTATNFTSDRSVSLEQQNGIAEDINTEILARTNLPESKESENIPDNSRESVEQAAITSKTSSANNVNESLKKESTQHSNSVASRSTLSVPDETNRDSMSSMISEKNRLTSGTESETEEEPTTPDKIDELNKFDDVGESENKHARKRGIISDKIDQKDTKDFVIVSHPKDLDAQMQIQNAITANDFLNNMMDTERLMAVTDAMSSRSYSANSFIIQEGETGSHFYVSAHGTFEVVKDGKSVIKSFGGGVVFGELAILYKARRFASIRVTEDSKVWALERKTFQKIMMRSGKRERDQNIKFLSSVSVLKELPPLVLSQISDLLKREFYAAGATIIKQGDPGDKFYIIRGGSVNILKSDSKVRDRVVGTLHRGAYFGEQALIHQDKRLASIIANPPGTECLTLDRKAFNNYLGGLEQIINTKIVDNPPSLFTGTHVTSEYDHIQIHELTFVGTLGIGGFGRVELVQLNKKQTFALKYLKKNEMVKQQQQEHAYSEKDIMLSCDSPFIVRLYKTFRDQKYLYFLMEACLGGDVWTILQQKKYFDEKTARFMTACVIEAFEYLHTRNMIYRDLKPENLMLDSKGYIKLVDFGFAKRMGPGQKTWTFAGTPEYVAPEIILNKGHDSAADYWALGVFIHELLIGKPPFRGKDHMKTYNLILRGIDVIQMSQKIPRKAQVLIKRLCRQNATDRLGYQKNGIADIKNHQWFAGFEWSKLRDRSMTAPLVRPVKSNTDLSNFDQYQEDRDVPPDENTGWDNNF